jgi:hypothetical protein
MFGVSDIGQRFRRRSRADAPRKNSQCLAGALLRVVTCHHQPPGSLCRSRFGTEATALVTCADSPAAPSRCACTSSSCKTSLSLCRSFQVLPFNATVDRLLCTVAAGIGSNLRFTISSCTNGPYGCAYTIDPLDVLNYPAPTFTPGTLHYSDSPAGTLHSMPLTHGYIACLAFDLLRSQDHRPGRCQFSSFLCDAGRRKSVQPQLFKLLQGFCLRSALLLVVRSSKFSVNLVCLCRSHTARLTALLDTHARWILLAHHSARSRASSRPTLKALACASPLQLVASRQLPLTR